MKNKSKFKIALFNFIIFLIILYIFYYKNYFDFHTIRVNYFPILGVSIIAILLDYILFGQVFLISSILSLIVVYIFEFKNFNSNSVFISNSIQMLGCILGFVLQMYMNSKKK